MQIAYLIQYILSLFPTNIAYWKREYINNIDNQLDAKITVY